MQLLQFVALLSVVFSGALAEISSKREYVRACYFTNWAQYRNGRAKYEPSDYIPGLCTHILYAFGWLNEDFTFKPHDTSDVTSYSARGLYEQVNELKLKQPGLKTLLSVGGWTFGTRLFKALAKTQSSRNVFIQSAIDFVRKHNFDGLDIDWEYPTGDVDNYSALIRETRLAFEAEAKRTGRDRLLLTAAVSAGDGTIMTSYDIGQCAKYFDFVFVMTYDFHGGWEMEVNNHAPLFASGNEVHWQKASAAEIWHKGGMPKNKIIIGIPTYARGWTLKDSTNFTVGARAKGPAKITKYVQESGVAAFYEVCDMLKSGARRMWNEKMHAPYLVSDGNQWWGYDDVQSVRNKMRWLRKNDYGGAFVWTLAFDDFNGQSCGGHKYPIIGTIANELAGIQIGGTYPVAVEELSTSTVSSQFVTAPGGAAVTEPEDELKKKCRTLADGQFFAGETEKGCSNQFYRCVHGNAHGFTCPGNLVFSSKTDTCVYEWQADCEVQSATESVSTLAVGESDEMEETPGACSHIVSGFAAAQDQCAKKFVTCYEGKPMKPINTCPDGFHFSTELAACQPESKLNGCVASGVSTVAIVGSSPIVASVTTESVAGGATEAPAEGDTNVTPFKCTSDGFYSDQSEPKDCRKFIRWQSQTV